MAASSTYPINGTPLIRGDPILIPVDITDAEGAPQDITGWSWRAHIRRYADGALVTEFSIETVTPPGGTVPSRLLLTLDPDQSRLLATGMVSDLEQITGDDPPVSIRTWWRITRFVVDQDVSRNEPLP